MSWESLYLCSFFRPKFQPAGRPVTTTLLTSQPIMTGLTTNIMTLVVAAVEIISAAAIHLSIMTAFVLLGAQLAAALPLASAPPVLAVTDAITDLQVMLAAGLIMNTVVPGEQAAEPMGDIATDISIAPVPVPVAAVLTAVGPVGLLTMLVQAASIVPAVRATLNALPAFAATDAGTALQVIPAILTMNTIMAVRGEQPLEMTPGINTVQDLDIVPEAVLVVAAPMVVGQVGPAGLSMIPAALLNTVPEAVV